MQLAIWLTGSPAPPLRTILSGRRGVPPDKPCLSALYPLKQPFSGETSLKPSFIRSEAVSPDKHSPDRHPGSRGRCRLRYFGGGGKGGAAGRGLGLTQHKSLVSPNPLPAAPPLLPKIQLTADNKTRDKKRFRGPKFFCFLSKFLFSYCVQKKKRLCLRDNEHDKR